MYAPAPLDLRLSPLWPLDVVLCDRAAARERQREQSKRSAPGEPEATMTSHGHGLMFHSAEKRAPKIEITEVTDEQSTLPPRKLVSALFELFTSTPTPDLHSSRALA